MRMTRLRAFAATATIGVGVLAASPAFAVSITSPPSPYTVQNNSAGVPQPFTFSASGFPANTSVYAAICDGTSITSTSWDPTANCDSGTSPAAVVSDASGNVTFNSTNPNFQIGVFDGTGPSGGFNCLYTGQTPPAGGLPSFTNCQLVVMDNAFSSVSPNKAAITLTLQAPVAKTPETPYAVALPLGAIAILGGGYVALRRRRNHSAGVAA